jgi:hypothetical protein
MKATTNGKLNEIPECELMIPKAGKYEQIKFNNLPDIGDSKSAVYNTEAIIGRSSPLQTYSYSSERTISLQIHLYIIEESDAKKNIETVRLIQSAVYPREGPSVPYLPPPICKLKCGKLLGDSEICVILQNYNVKFPTEIAWSDYKGYYCPYKLDIDTNWIVVYTSSDLPFQNRIFNSGL